jgi:phosphoglycerate dehydrogenase-like enzyme
VLSVLGCGLLTAQQKKILVTGVAAEGIKELQAASPGATIIGVTDNKELLGQVGDADAIIGTINPELVRAGKKLKWVQIGSAGVERYLHLSTPELRDGDITLTNGKIIQGPEIADHAFALLLTLTRNTRRYVLEQSKEEWPRGRERLIELRDKTAVVIGVGGIGTQIAVRAKAFGMKVIGVDPKDIPLAPYLDGIVQPNRLDTVLPEADVVFVAAPHTPESDQMMGSRQFDLMKKDSYFVAVSRGRLYSTDALVRALDSRKLAGAGLDVTDPEPLPKGHALWKFDNVVITPHIAGGSDGIGKRRMDLYKENIRRFVAGEPLLNVVDKRKGY